MHYTTLHEQLSQEFNQDVIDWILLKMTLLSSKFIKKYPRARNIFNVEIPNTRGTKKILVLNRAGLFSVSNKAAYTNALSWQSLRTLGCPKN